MIAILSYVSLKIIFFINNDLFLHCLLNLYKALLQRMSSILKGSPKGTEAQGGTASPKHSSPISPATLSTRYQSAVLGGKKKVKKNKKST